SDDEVVNLLEACKNEKSGNLNGQ
ncbi:MAG: hypothetical protein RIT35_1568, partial [Pseudomonadota bacterium]